MWWYGNPMGGWGYAFMALAMVLFWGVIILGVIGVVRYLMSTDRSATSRPTAEDVLAERFARGEIDEQEYHQRRDALRSKSRPNVKS